MERYNFKQELTPGVFRLLGRVLMPSFIMYIHFKSFGFIACCKCPRMVGAWYCDLHHNCTSWIIVLYRPHYKEWYRNL